MTGTAAKCEELGGLFEAPEHYEGYALRDPLGKKIGNVEKIFANGDWNRST